MFASPSSSSSSETPQLNVVEAAARAHAVRARRGRRKADAEEEVIRRALDEPGTQSVLGHAAGSARTPRKDTSRYIGKLVTAAQVRKDDAERLAEHRILLQRQEQDAAFPEKPRFISKSYRAALQQRADDARDSEAHSKSKPSASKHPDDLSNAEPATGAARQAPHVSLLRFVSADMPRTNDEDPHILQPHHEQLLQEHSPSKPDKVQPDLQKLDSRQGTNLRADHKSGLALDSFSAHDVHNLSTSDAPRQPRKSRFSSVQSPMNEHPSTKPMLTPKRAKKRGMRRNDEQAVEAYRQRYFKRRAAICKAAGKPFDIAQTKSMSTLH